MINLIPNQEKKRMRRDFYYRLIVLLLFALSNCFLVVTVALLPAYFLSVVKNKTANNKLESQKEERLPVFDDATRASTTDLNKKLDSIEAAQKNDFPVSSKVIDAVLGKKLPGMKITQISYTHDATKGKTIDIRGTAPSREVLLQFRQAFEGDNAFSSVNLPISNFVKGSNIEFILSVKP